MPYLTIPRLKPRYRKLRVVTQDRDIALGLPRHSTTRLGYHDTPYNTILTKVLPAKRQLTVVTKDGAVRSSQALNTNRLCVKAGSEACWTILKDHLI